MRRRDRLASGSRSPIPPAVSTATEASAPKRPRAAQRATPSATESTWVRRGAAQAWARHQRAT
jgi:hypothetical protein